MWKETRGYCLKVLSRLSPGETEKIREKSSVRIDGNRPEIRTKYHPEYRVRQKQLTIFEI
jgi:hypothetical protein